MKKILIIMFALFLFGISSIGIVEATDFRVNNLGYWQMQTSLALGLIDSSPGGNDMTATGTIYDSGTNGFLYDGTDDFTTIPISMTGTDSFTISEWIYLDVPLTQGALFGGATNTYSRNIIIFSDGTVGMALTSSDSYVNGVSSSLGIGTWYHIVATYDGTNKKIYFDGNLEWSQTVSAGTPSGDTSYNIGKRAPSDNFFKGKISTLGVYDYAMDLAEVQELNSKGRDYNPYSGVADYSVSITTPIQYQAFQRDNLTGDIYITGNYGSNVTAIQARFNNSGWTTINNSLTGGSFTGTLNTNYGSGTLEIRSIDNTTVTASKNDIILGDLYIIAGQSNNVGFGQNLQTLNVNNDWLSTNYVGGNGVWKKTDDPLHYYSGANQGTGGAFPLLINKLSEISDVPVSFIATAVGGTPLSDWQKGGVWYDTMITQVNQATNGDNKVKGYLFFQGEKDAYSSVNTPYAIYLQGLIDMTNDLKADLTIDNIIIGQIGQIDLSDGTGEQVDVIRRAQLDSWDNINITQGISTYDISTGPDNVHFYTDLQLDTLAQRWAYILNEKVYGTGTGNAPKINNAFIGSDKTILTLSLDTSSLEISKFDGTSGTLAKGFIISNGVTTLTDSNIIDTTINNNTLIITLDAAIDESYSITLGSFTDAINKTILRSSNYGKMPVQTLYSLDIKQVIGKTEQTYSQTQLSTININDTDWHTITSGNFTIELDGTINYIESTIHVASLTNNMIISCRNNLDNIVGIVTNKLPLNNGNISSNILLSNNITLQAGTHNISLECMNEVIGNTIIGASVGIGHVMKTVTGENINYKNHQFTNTINSGAIFSEIGSTSFIANKAKTDNKYILVDWSAKINNTHTQDQTISIYPRIENIINNKNCEQNIQFIKSGEFKTVGGICILNVNELLTNTISLYGTGIATDYIANFNIKEFDYLTVEETKTNILTGITSNSVTFVEKASTTFTTEISNAEVVVKGSVSTSSSGNDILYGQIQVLDETETLIYQSKDIAMNTNSNSNDITFQTITPIKSGTNTFKLLLRSATGNLVTIDSGEINGYITQKLEIQDNALDIKIFEFWDNSQLSNFSVVIGGVTYSTTGTTISAIGTTPYQDILINKVDYNSRIYSQHDTTLDLNASIGKYRLDIKALEALTENEIQDFTIETDIGSFNATNGVITLYPLQQIYNNWNITTEDYYNKTGLEFQVGETYKLEAIKNFTDTILNFKDILTTNDIFPTCLYNGFTVNSPYNLVVSNFDDTLINCSLSGYNYFIQSLPKSPIPQNQTYNMNKTTLNIKMFDQENLGQINFDITIINASESTVSFTNQSNFSKNYNEIPTGDITIYIDGINGSIEYSEARFYNTLTEFTNIEINGYLTKKDDSSVITFQVNEKGFATGGIGDVNVEIQKRISGNFVTIVEALTDVDGRTFVSVDIAEPYKVIFKKDGFVTATADLIPGVTEYTVEMALESEAVTYIEDISYQFFPTETMLNINDTYKFSGFISTVSLSLIEFEIREQNGIILYSDSSTNPTGTEFIKDLIITDGMQVITIEMKYHKNGEIKTLTKEYTVINSIGFIERARAWAREDTFLNNFIKFFISMILIASALTLSNMSDIKEINLFVIPVFAFLGFIEFIGWLQVTVFVVIALAIYMGGKN